MLEQYGLHLALVCAVIAILYGIISARWISARCRPYCSSMKPLPRVENQTTGMESMVSTGQCDRQPADYGTGS